MTRRSLLAGAAALALTNPARAQALDGSTLGVRPGADVTGMLSAALRVAHERGQPLFLPAGEYLVDNLEMPGSMTLLGHRGLTVLVAAGDGPALRIANSSDVVLESLVFAPLEGAVRPAKTASLRSTAAPTSLSATAASSTRAATAFLSIVQREQSKAATSMVMPARQSSRATEAA